MRKINDDEVIWDGLFGLDQYADERGEEVENFFGLDFFETPKRAKTVPFEAKDPMSQPDLGIVEYLEDLCRI